MFKFIKLSDVPVGVTFVFADISGTMRVLRKIESIEHLNQSLCEDVINESLQLFIPMYDYDVIVYES